MIPAVHDPKVYRYCLINLCRCLGIRNIARCLSGVGACELKPRSFSYSSDDEEDR